MGILFHLTSGTPSGGSTMFMMSLINLQVKNSSFIILELVFVLHTFNKREQHCQAYFVFQQYWYNWNFTIHTAHWRTHERKPMTTTTYCHFLSMSSVWATPDLYFRILYRAHEKKMTTTTYCSFLSMSSVWATLTCTSEFCPQLWLSWDWVTRWPEHNKKLDESYTSEFLFKFIN